MKNPDGFSCGAWVHSWEISDGDKEDILVGNLERMISEIVR